MIEVKWLNEKNVGYGKCFTDIKEAYVFVTKKTNKKIIRDRITSIEADMELHSVKDFLRKYEKYSK